jgi:hypothetical protein
MPMKKPARGVRQAAFVMLVSLIAQRSRSRRSLRPVLYGLTLTRVVDRTPARREASGPPKPRPPKPAPAIAIRRPWPAA